MGTLSMNKNNLNGSKIEKWKQKELSFLVAYSIVFFIIFIARSLQLSLDHYTQLYGLRQEWLIPNHLNVYDLSILLEEKNDFDKEKKNVEAVTNCSTLQRKKMDD